MPMIIAWDNKADAATLTAGSEISSLPGANVQNAHVSRKWQTAAGVNSSYVIFDMLSSVACAALAVLGTNLTAAATVRVRASDVDPTVTGTLLRDTGLLAAGVKAGYGAIYKAFVSATARYWRVDLADASLSVLQAGRIFLGPYWSPTAGQDWGWSVLPLDESTRTKSYGKQTYVDPRPQVRVLAFNLDWMSEADVFANPFAMARANGVVKDVLAIHDINGTYLSEQAVWGLAAAAKPLINRITRTWTQGFTIEERL